MALVDLTQPFRDGMFVMGALPRVTVERLRSMPEHDLNITRMDCAVHSGTHLDAPNHFIFGGRSISELSLDDVSGPASAIRIDCSPEHEISAAALEQQATGLVRDGDILFIETGWSQYFAEDTALYRRHPYLSIEAAEWIVERKIKIVALDIPTPDRPETMRDSGFDFPVHHLLLGRDILIGEHLTNLAALSGRRSHAYAFPLPIVGADGSPVRFVADIG